MVAAPKPQRSRRSDRSPPAPLLHLAAGPDVRQHVRLRLFFFCPGSLIRRAFLRLVARKNTPFSTGHVYSGLFVDSEPCAPSFLACFALTLRRVPVLRNTVSQLLILFYACQSSYS